MNCASCGEPNRAGARFCGGCGQTLAERCPACGVEVEPGRRFCDACGAPFPARPAETGGARKVVTIVFADLVGSTALHERLDAESARLFMESYYQAMRGAVEGHGGTVTQLLGDGVKALFGAPRVAEDDAIRAVRAAVEMQRAFGELAQRHGGAVGKTGLRVAVNTGEVVASDASEIIGDPVNVAARLQEKGGDGDVVIGEATRRLVAELVTLVPLGSFVLKGRAEPVAAYRVVSLDRPAGAPAIAFVGRDDELARLHAVFEAAVATPAARLAVLLGSPGLGKSRLLTELARRLGERASVLVAQCNAAGGASLAPLADALRAHLHLEDASGDALHAAIAAVATGEDAERARIASGIAALLAGSPGSAEETFFVMRRLLTALAAERPLVLAIDDLQWAEPLLLDLTEHLVQWGAGVPLLVLAAARPELRDTRSALASPGGLVADVVTLGGLEAGAATRLAANVIGAAELPAAVAGRLLATSEGNPLFLAELVRMLVHDGALKREGDRWTTGVELAALDIPPTIHALLAARIERLRPEDRSVLEHAAVIGRQFSRAAVAHLLSREGTDLDARLESLRRSELIEPDTGWFLGEPALRFHHVLIRDAAYRRLLKNTRATLHSRLADWVEARVGEAVEHDETIGWHLEQAHVHLGELGPVDAQGRSLGERAARHLAGAGRRALARDDVPLAASLLGRALARLDGADPARADLALDWCEALLSAGDVGAAAGAIEELGRFTEGADRLCAWHTCFAGQLAALTDPQALRGTADAVAAAAAALASLGDAAGEAKAHSVHALALARLGKVGACEAALDKALAAARRAHDRRRANGVLAGAPLAALWGPSPVTRASGRCLDVVRVLRITQGAPAVEAVALQCQGVLEALRGRTEAARRMIASSRQMVEELGITHRLLDAEVFAGRIELLEDDAVAAERCLRTAYDGLRALGLGIDAARAAALLARALLALDRAADAEALSHESEALAGDDLQAAIAWRGVRAEALARRGEHAAAVELASKAVEIAAATDALLDHADARLALAAAQRAAGRRAEADAEEVRAIELWEAKGATLLAERARRSDRVAVEVERAAESRVESERPIRRRVQPNAATAHAAREDAAFAARDGDAIATLFASEAEVVDHSNGTTHDRMEWVHSVRVLLTARDLTRRHEPLATLGDALALCGLSLSSGGIARGNFDVGAYEYEGVVLFEVDAQGRCRRADFFAADRAGDAIARLYERYAELLPEGPERTRAAATARSTAAMLEPSDVDRFGAALAPAAEYVDHRLIGVGSRRGAHGILQAIAALNDLEENRTTRIDDILELRSDALLVRRTNFGTGRDSGGAYEKHFLQLLVFGADGLTWRCEMFDVDRDAEALARFDELVAETPAVRRVLRRVRANAATANATRGEAAIVAGDIETFGTLLAADLDAVHHPTGATYDRLGALAAARSLKSARDPAYRVEPLAILGDSLALCRRSMSASGFAGRTFDVGSYESEEFLFIEVDAQGRRRRAEYFAGEHLGDAIARLYERYAELLPDGLERTRAAATARSVAALPLAGPIDIDRWATVFAPDIEAVDPRTVGFGSLHGAEEFVRVARAFRELVEDPESHVEDVLDLRSDALLVRWTNSGTLGGGGGAFERTLLMLWTFGADGLVTRWEQLDADRDAEALARFDELAAGAKPAPRRVRANAATANAARIDAAIAARDADAFPALLADTAENVHHPTGTTYDRPGLLATWRLLLRARDPTCRHQPLASLGDSLALFRVSLSGSAFAGGTFDVGAYERENIYLIEVDAQGRHHRGEIFAVEALGDAVVRLYERYAELLPDGSGRTRAAATARSVAAFLGPFDLDRYAAAFAPAIEVIDDRTLGTWSAHGADAALRHFRSLVEVADEIGLREVDVLGLEPDSLLARRIHRGIDRSGGGAYERHFLMLLAFGADGRMTRLQWFDADRDAEALACFDQLTSGAKPALRRVRANAATAHAAREDAAFAARDADAFAALFADDLAVVDHPNGAVHDWREHLESMRMLLRAQDLTRGQEPLATLGDTLALCRLSLSSGEIARGNFDVGAYEYEGVNLYEVDAQGRCRRAEYFAGDHLRDAIARLYERYAELLPEGPERTRAAATARSYAATVGSFDLDRYAAAFAPAIEAVDHRTLGTWSADGAEALLEHQRSLLDLVDDAAIREDEVLSLHSDAFLSRRTHFGTGRAGGGAYERQFLIICVFGTEGLLTRLEWFDADRDAEALARFDELTAKPRAVPRRVRPNAATANAARVDAAVAARDGDAFPNLFAEAMEMEDHPTAVTYDRQGELFSFRSLLRARDPISRHEPLATLGDSLALCRASIASSGFAGGTLDVGAHEREGIFLIEVDAQGRRQRGEFFASDHLGDAIARLYERYADLLPEGPEQARAAATARSVATLSGSLDLDRLTTAFAPLVESVDHRILGTWSARGARAVLEGFRALFELTESFELRADDILGLRPDALLVRWTNFGTLRDGDGAFERRFLLLRIFGPDGLVSRVEEFDADRDDEALARFDELTAAAKPAPRRVRSNAAIANTARFDAAVAERDADALPTLLADSSAVIEHPTGATYDREGSLASWRALLTARDPTSRHEPLASLGDSLALCRLSTSATGLVGRTLDVGAYEREEIALIEVDAQARRGHTEIFAANHLGDAVARLYERYAELLPEGPERARAAATARSVAALVERFEPDRFATALAPAVDYTDHRTLGFGSLRGAKAVLRGARALLEIADDLSLRVDDVLGLRSDALLLRETQSGTARASGGAFERLMLVLWVFGPDGLLTRWESFDADRDAEALARFDELTTAAKPAPRRVRANAATANAARTEAAIAARDIATYGTLFADDLEIVHHPTGTTYDRQGALAQLRSLLSARDPTARLEPLASLGDSLALCRQSWSASGVAGRTFDVGPYENENIYLIEVDAQQRRRRGEIFASDHLGDAIARLYERYGELLPDGPERTGAAATARSVAAMADPVDVGRYGAALAPAAEFVDHRTLGLGSAHGAQRILRGAAAAFELEENRTTRFDDILDLRSGALLVRRTVFGTGRASGGDYERHFLQLLVFGADGLVSRWEQFDIDRDADALARFDELTATAKPAPRRVRPNAATANVARLDAAIAARDGDAITTLHAGEMQVVNHHLAGGEFGLHGVLATYRSLLAARDPTSRHEPLATLGDSLVLCRMLVSASGFSGRKLDVGAYEIENLALVDVDSDGRQQRGEYFVNDRLGDAVARLYARYAELLPDGPERARAAATARSLPAMLDVSDVDRYRAALAPAAEYVDHRTLGLGSRRGAPGILRALAALLELEDDRTTRIDDVLDARPGALLVRKTIFGTVRASGGAYESPSLVLLVFGADGLVSRYEQFDAERDAAALARLDVLAAESPAVRPVPRRVRPNAATAHGDRLDAAIAAHDAAALPALFSDDTRAIDHTVHTEWDGVAMLGSWRTLALAEDPTCRREPLATLGNSLALCRMQVSASGLARGSFDVGAYEKTGIELIAVDAQGRRCWTELFAVEKLGDAVVRLYERYTERLPEGPARACAAATARSVAALAQPFELERYAAALATGVESVDHRTLGTWSAQGAEALLRHYRSLLELADGVAMRDDDVLGLSSEALLVRRTHLGTDRAGGGRYERQFLALFVFGSDGLITRSELFDADRDAEALARFDEVTAEPPAAQFANAAARAFEQSTRAIAQCDWDALVALYAPEHVSDDRRSLVRTRVEGAAWFADLRRVFRAWREGSHYLFATRGDRLALLRHKLTSVSGDAGPAEFEMLNVIEVDAAGRRVALVTFDADALDAAYAELDARYAAGEAAPFSRNLETMLRVPRAVAARDWQELASAFAPDFALEEHRAFGTLGTLSRDDWVASARALVALRPDAALRADHVLALDDRRGLAVVRWVGSEAEGSFEIPAVVAMELGVDSIRRWYAYDLDQQGAARACYDALASESPAPRIENAATRAFDRLVAAWEARDWKRVAELFPPDFRQIDRRAMVQLEIDRDQHLEWSRTAFEMSSSRIENEVLATRGDRLALSRHRVEVADHSLGPSEIESLMVLEVDDHGERVAAVRFDPHDLDAAYTELDQRYAAGEAAPYARMWEASQRIVRVIAARDWERMASVFTEDFLFEDHRLFGWGTRSRDEVQAQWRAMVDLAPDATLPVDHVLAINHRGVLNAGRWVGSRDGGVFEIPFIAMWLLGPDGRIRRSHAYDPDQQGAARASFDALTSESPAPRKDREDPLRIPPNAATRAIDRLEEVREARDWDALDALCAATLAIDDRRPLLRLSGDREMFVASVRQVSNEFRNARTLLATAGDRLALERHVFERQLAMEGAGAPDSQVELLHLVEVDTEGRIVAMIAFDPDDRRAASAELYERFARSGAAGRIPAGEVEYMRALRDRDLDRARAQLPDDFFFHDHRRTGPGRLGSADEYVAFVATLFEQSPDVLIESLYIVAAEAHGILDVAHLLGTRDGGEFEIVVARIMLHQGGRPAGVELFELDDLDVARARFEELRPRKRSAQRAVGERSPSGSPPIPPTAAMRASDRMAEAFAAGDWDALRALAGDEFRFDDRSRWAQVSGDVEMWITAVTFLVSESAALAERELLGTVGDRIALYHTAWRGASGGTPFELDKLRITEVDAEGKLRAFILFDPGDRRAAFAEAQGRFAAGEAAASGGQAPIASLVRAIGRHDWEALRVALAPDAVISDRRAVSILGECDREQWIDSLRTLAELAPDMDWELSRLLDWNGHGRVGEGRLFGTARDGGPFENPFVAVLLTGGDHVQRYEFFDVADADRALARFEELCAARISNRRDAP